MAVKPKPRYVMYWQCRQCQIWRLRSDYCLGCGSPRTSDVTWRDPENDEEWKLSYAQGATNGVLADAVNGKFCANCESRIPMESQFCPGCGKQLDGTEQAPTRTLTTPEGEKTAKLETHPDYVERPVDPTGFISAGGSQEEKTSGTSKDEVASPRRRNHEEVTRKLLSEKQEELNRVLKSAISRTSLPIYGLSFLVVPTIIILFVLFLVFVFWPRTTTGTLVDLQYQPYLGITYIQRETGECWENECPNGFVVTNEEEKDFYPGGQSVVSTEEYEVQPYGHIQVDTEYNTDVEDVLRCESGGEPQICKDIVDGVATEFECTPEPKCGYEAGPTEEIPIYATLTPYMDFRDVLGTNTPYPRKYISFYRDLTLQRIQVLGDWVSGKEVTYPEYSLDSEKQESFTGERGSYYRVVFLLKNGKTQYFQINSYDEWKMLQSYENRDFELTTILGGGITKYKLPE